MKYKVGDKVKIVENLTNHQLDLGTIVEILEIDGKKYKCFGLDTYKNKDYWFVQEDEIAPFDYTWDDFLKAPIGTKVTFEGGEHLFKADKGTYGDEFANIRNRFSYEDLENFEIKDSDYGKIIKIEEPTYTIVYEPEEVTMPEIEEMKRLTDELCKTCDEFIKKIKEK